MGTVRHSPVPLWLGAAVAACLMTVALGLAVTHDGAWSHLLRPRRSSSSNSSAPPEPPKDASGRPLPPPDGHGHGHGRGRRDVNSALQLHSLNSDAAAEASGEHVTSAWSHLLRPRRSSSSSSSSSSRRSSNSSAPPQPSKDASGRPLPPPNGRGNARGRREVNRAPLLHRLNSDAEYSPSSGAREKRSSGDEELVPPAEAVEVDSGSGRERRSSNHSAPPTEPPPSRGRRGAGDLDRAGTDAEGWEQTHEQQGEEVAASRGRRASNHSAPPSGLPPASRKQPNHHTEHEEISHALRRRRESSEDSSSSDDDDDNDDDDEETSTSSSRRPPPHGRDPPPRGCRGRRPPTGSGTNSTSTDTETVERLTRRRGRNRG